MLLCPSLHRAPGSLACSTLVASSHLHCPSWASVAANRGRAAQTVEMEGIARSVVAAPVGTAAYTTGDHQDRAPAQTRRRETAAASASPDKVGTKHGGLASRRARLEHQTACRSPVAETEGTVLRRRPASLAKPWEAALAEPCSAVRTLHRKSWDPYWGRVATNDSCVSPRLEDRDPHERERHRQDCPNLSGSSSSVGLHP
mmetsp:Transcript_16453/g.44579  ORF Transcript_16453/g.44579 Transcript_16453/m.44579 type:complete len:201 (-) Transcript_16453:730-1332(-)